MRTLLVLTIPVAARILPTYVADFLSPVDALVIPATVCGAAVGIAFGAGAALAVAVRRVCMCFRVR